VPVTDGDVSRAAGRLLESLDVLRVEGVTLKPSDPLVRKYEEAIERLWADLPAELRKRLSAAFQATFGFDRADVKTPLYRGAFADVVGGGWWGEYLKYVSPGKSTPQFFFGAALAFIAAGLARKPRIVWEAVPLFPNQYILLVGGTGAGKGAAVARAQSVVASAMGPNILPNEGTHQGYAERLRDRWNQTQVAADGLIIAEEFRVLLSEEKSKREVVTWLTQWYQWDGPWSRALRGEAHYEFCNPCVSLLGASNLAWLRKIPEDAITGGFLPRFLLFHTREEDEPWGVAMPRFDEGLCKQLQEQLRAINPPELLMLTPESVDWINWWHDGPRKQEYDGHGGEQVRKWLQRKQAHIMKTATVRHLVEHHEGGLCVECLQWARRLVDWLTVDVTEIFEGLGQTERGAIYADLLAYLHRRGGEALERDIRRGVRNKYRVKEIKDALAALKDDGDVEMDTGPRGTRWGVTKGGV
jgi:hypothetical protein